ncbi:MAG: isochorismatase family protein [Lachnospiraceae bacterium]|nr:isochorismatase family protein [Lachnospiraceae bacterium]
MSKALVVIDIQNDITKNYRGIIDRINSAIDWAQSYQMQIVYIQHNNISVGTRTFKPGTPFPFQTVSLIRELGMMMQKEKDCGMWLM